MGKQSGLLKRRTQIEELELTEMRRTMIQFCFDTLSVTMHEDFGWGYQRMKQLEGKWQEKMDFYTPALKTGMEQDVFQERLDRAIRSFMPEDAAFYPFKERYPNIAVWDYVRRRR